MSKSIPDNVLALLAQADKAKGFPVGTMVSVMQQETGGNAKYLSDPSTYHYAENANGQRIAGHTGKVSTAFGPFGILESTGAKPGFGVQPLQNKSLEEQVRFAGDYLAARSKSAGGLSAGLAGYGEGNKYAQQVAGRIAGGQAKPSILAAPDTAMPTLAQYAAVTQQQQQIPAESVVPLAQMTANQPAEIVPSPNEMQATINPWQAFQQSAMQKEQVLPEQLQFGGLVSQMPQVAALPIQQQGNVRSPMSALRALKGWV